jgi:hypothetical protein
MAKFSSKASKPVAVSSFLTVAAELPQFDLDADDPVPALSTSEQMRLLGIEATHNGEHALAGAHHDIEARAGELKRSIARLRELGAEPEVLETIYNLL